MCLIYRILFSLICYHHQLNSHLLKRKRLALNSFQNVQILSHHMLKTKTQKTVKIVATVQNRTTIKMSQEFKTMVKAQICLIDKAPKTTTT